jgi:6-phosphogluconolactonase (cycloisomerase 2 family)
MSWDPKNEPGGVYGLEADGFADPSILAPGTITSTKLGYLANVTSDIQAQINALISGGVAAETQNGTFTTGINTTTDIIIAAAPILDTSGSYTLDIIDDVTGNQLTILFQLCVNNYNFLSRPAVKISTVNDSAGIITESNLSQYLTFFAHYRSTTPNPYIAVTFRLTGGLLYGSTDFTFVCTRNSRSFNSDNPVITGYICYDLTALPAPDISLTLDGITNAIGTYPASSVYAYCVNRDDNTVNQYRINSITGQLANLSPATIPIAADASAEDMISTPNGEFVYIPSGGSNIIQMYGTNIITGQLVPLTTPTISVPVPFYIAMHPSGKFVYVVTVGSDLHMFSVNSATGILSPLTPASIPAGTFPWQMAITPNGKFLYVTDITLNEVRQFSIDVITGLLTPLGTPTIGAGNEPISITVHPSGEFAYVTNHNDNTISPYSIDSVTGQLTLLTPLIIGTGSGPLNFTITPNGLFGYVINVNDATIGCYIINTTTGQLILQTPASISGTNPGNLRISPNNKFLYVSITADALIGQYSIDNSTGQLTPLPAPTIPAGAVVKQIIII